MKIKKNEWTYIYVCKRFIESTVMIVEIIKVFIDTLKYHLPFTTI